MTPTEFVKLLKPYAVNVQQRFYIPWEITLAQAALETGWLAHPMKDKNNGKDSFNLFGIKADRSWSGPTVSVITHEYVNGTRVEVEAKFRAYKDYTGSMADRAMFLMRNQRYSRAMAQCKDPIAFAIELQRAGYATDPDYSEKLISIMTKYMGVVA